MIQPAMKPEYDPDGDRDFPGPQDARELRACHPAGFDRAYAEYLSIGCESADDPVGAATIEGFLVNADANDWLFMPDGGAAVNDANAARNDAIRAIAQRELSIETLETRKSDALDFHDVSVWGVNAALTAAYEAGRIAERAQKPPSICDCPACGRRIEITPLNPTT